MSKTNRYEKADIRAENPRRADRRWVLMILPMLLSGVASAHEHTGPTGSETTEIRLRYDRRDLTSPAAARRLLVRIGDAALEACGASPFSLAEFKIATRSSRCWRDAVDRTVSRIGSPTLSALIGEAGTDE
jgi:UrcA family protein